MEQKLEALSVASVDVSTIQRPAAKTGIEGRGTSRASIGAEVQVQRVSGY